MKIYDSLTNKNIELVTNKITIYNCGPTVYNDVHIGNIRPVITFDVLHRLLLAYGFNVQMIHNITDIDDKIINRSQELNISESEVSNIYHKNYLEILKTFRIPYSNYIMPKVSDNIDGIIEYIQKLINVNAAYTTPTGDVYFDVNKIKNYGCLSHQNIDELKINTRSTIANDKRSPLDFVLWKTTNNGLKWHSPWSTGRPGWHTECAYFINKYCVDHVTIHGGGIDLKFPHHENENAQNNALFNRNIADIWMHVGHINVNNEKMAKSANNFILVKDILKTFSPNIIRWFMFSTKYQNPLNYSLEILQQTKKDFIKFIKNINLVCIEAHTKNHPIKFNLEAKAIPDFLLALQDDLDFPNAIAAIHKQTKQLMGLLKAKKYDELQQSMNSIYKSLFIIGIEIYHPMEQPAISSLIIEWKSAIDRKDYVLADKYRSQLEEKGII